jgi:asparagine synthase (glutamine-hydrolysing)
MSPSYALIIGQGRSRPALAEQLANGSGLSIGYSNARMVALVNRDCGCVPLAGAGCVLGTLFRRHGPAEAITSLTPSDAAAIARSGGLALLDAFWGGYVAAMADADSVRVMRDPSAALPCYHAGRERFTIFASDADILASADLELEIDFAEVGRQLYRAFVPQPSTALRGIRELLAGFAVRLCEQVSAPVPCWSPWDHVAPRDEPRTVTAERLARVVQHCVHAWGATQRRLLLSISGGLDSSIVAACLARARVETVCLTMFTDDPSGDERPFARAICERVGLPLVERPYRLEDIDIREPLAANFPRPRDRTQANAHERVHEAVALEVGTESFMTGNGGDHVFNHSQSAAAIADRYLSEGLRSGAFATLLDVCRQTGSSLSEATRHAWRLASSPPSYRVRANPLFLDRSFVAGISASELHHPWLDGPHDALPGKAAHVATILRVQPALEPSGGRRFSLLNPLVSQPVVETCLSVPTWQWREGGRDRSLAREAFAEDLPSVVVNRRVKGTPGRFAARLLDHCRVPIRDRLINGWLAKHGIVDVAALDGVLAGERPVPDLQRVRVLELVNAEAWLDHWMVRLQASKPPGANVRWAGRGPTPS